MPITIFLHSQKFKSGDFLFYFYFHVNQYTPGVTWQSIVNVIRGRPFKVTLNPALIWQMGNISDESILLVGLFPNF